MRLGRHRQEEAPEPVVEDPRRTPEDLSVHAGGLRLGELLVDSGRLDVTAVVDALRRQVEQPDQRIGEIMLAQAAISEQILAVVLASQGHVPMVDLRTVSPDPEATKLLTEPRAREFVALPLSVGPDGTVRVAVADPTPESVARIRAAIGRPVAVEVATVADIVLAIGNSYRALTGIESQVKEFEIQDEVRREAAKLETAVASDSAPVVQVVHRVITQGLRDRASDIHIEPQEDRVRVRFRVDGALHDALTLPASIGPAVVSRIKIMGGMNIVERRRPQDGQITLTIEGREVDIRVSTTATIWGEKVVMRLLDKSRPLYKLQDLGMPDDIARQYSQLLHSPYGMVICAGPTGAGKTTTLYGSLGEINSPERNVMTIEDPVEYTFESINQIQINEQAGVTFAGGLRSILRQDPDVILVGEIRDVETARIAVQSALTGHFVLSSLHATDAVSALHRLLDMGIETFLIASSVTAVVAQRLVRRICPHCRQSYSPPPEQLEFLREFGDSALDGEFAHGAGCNFCSHTGFLDRIGVYELMPITESVRELILMRASHDELGKQARADGMLTLQEEAARLVQAGITTVPEVLRSIYVVGG
jgi:type IV pilus assembly protein PilB